ncbi:ATP-binding protein [Shewanella waksmanii]|uniref:ATP-binding protein n=1 Tax=Shewanella waksmanii TaxID=213783 RepID=UPI00048F5A63|nr:ATP-binding protein [Shewanella waksmanii]
MNSLQFNLSQSAIHSQHFCTELDQFLLQNSIIAGQRFKIVTCILEAVANIAQHSQVDLAQVSLIIRCERDKVTIDLLDNSPFIEPQKPSCPPPLSLTGRGLWIMQNWMDQVRVQASVAGTHLRLSLLRH